ncbi:MAG: 2-dehydropantoate 2-reductase [Elusimicrobia bacterium]|nr:2-dehydropantoate 2-reductase [Elusimicrobiota bacterium]MDE2237215.1 2-dehydropantoate 2-reductase [Elusimicrobiota bacterium]MDE2424557.1 2-dehydropantoate 2-reductase [Elusimicrobiota bacterium]
MADLLIVGPGAIGGVLACRWLEAGCQVMALASHAEREARLSRRGLSFTANGGYRRAWKIESARRRGPRPPARAAFFCVKNHQTARAIETARPWIGPETIVVGLQNGLGHERLFRRAYGRRRVVLGVCYVAADRTAPLSVFHAGGRSIQLAADADNARAARRAAAWLRAGGWRVSLLEDEDAMLWTKLCLNAAGNPLGALSNAANGQLSSDPCLRNLLATAAREAAAAARADGHRLLVKDLSSALGRTFPRGSRQRNSMLQDLSAGRRTENSAILGPILSAAKRRGLRLSLLPRLNRLLERLERRP